MPRSKALEQAASQHRKDHLVRLKEAARVALGTTATRVAVENWVWNAARREAAAALRSTPQAHQGAAHEEAAHELSGAQSAHGQQGHAQETGTMSAHSEQCARFH